MELLKSFGLALGLSLGAVGIVIIIYYAVYFSKVIFGGGGRGFLMFMGVAVLGILTVMIHTIKVRTKSTE